MTRSSNGSRKEVSKFTKQLHDNETKGYNWDKREITVYGGGRHIVNRTCYDFHDTPSLTSPPEEIIKKEYFHAY